MATPLVSHTVGNGSNNFSSSHTEKGFYYVIKLPALLMLTVVSSKKGEKKISPLLANVCDYRRGEKRGPGNIS